MCSIPSRHPQAETGAAACSLMRAVEWFAGLGAGCAGESRAARTDGGQYEGEHHPQPDPHGKKGRVLLSHLGWDGSGVEVGRQGASGPAAASSRRAKPHPNYFSICTSGEACWPSGRAGWPRLCAYLLWRPLCPLGSIFGGHTPSSTAAHCVALTPIHPNARITRSCGRSHLGRPRCDVRVCNPFSAGLCGMLDVAPLAFAF